MSIGIEEAVETTALHVCEAERVELELVAETLGNLPPRHVDEAAWVQAARDLSGLVPVRLRQALRRFTVDCGRDGLLRLRGALDPRRLPPDGAIHGGTLALLALQLGDLVAFREGVFGGEANGGLIGDVPPPPGNEALPGEAGPGLRIMHVEYAFHRNRPDFIGLLCLRSTVEDMAALHIASIRHALDLVDAHSREVLRQPRFVTATPFSPDDTAPHPILTGAIEDPDLTVDFYWTEALDEESEYAMYRLSRALEAVHQTVCLSPGDAVFIDNRLAAHGPAAGTPGSASPRWLQRVYIHRDLRRSRPARPGDGLIVR